MIFPERSTKFMIVYSPNDCF